MNEPIPPIPAEVEAKAQSLYNYRRARKSFRGPRWQDLPEAEREAVRTTAACILKAASHG